ncbi:sensor histidine kinase [candidate division KSB1 bacterium]|nr:sensor histidine kinase [candidate division KSB1 bacterium]
MTYRDNGVGIPDNVDFERTSTLGLNLVRMLAQQIDGTATYERGDWTTFRIAFKGYDSSKIAP